MSLTSGRLAIGQSLVAILQGIQNAAASADLYSLVQLGAVFNPSNNALWCEVTHLQGQGKPAGSGGDMVGWRIDEETQWLLTSGIGPYETDSTTTQKNMLAAQDLVLPALHTHFQLPSASNPSIAIPSVYSVLPIQIDRSRPAKFPNGHFYLLWSLPVIVKQQYNVELSIP
jgi:hypothetical protein